MHSISQQSTTSLCHSYKERGQIEQHTSKNWSYSAVAIQRTICINDVLHVTYNWLL